MVVVPTDAPVKARLPGTVVVVAPTTVVATVAPEVATIAPVVVMIRANGGPEEADVPIDTITVPLGNTAPVGADADTDMGTNRVTATPGFS